MIKTNKSMPVFFGVAHIRNTFNNTIITISDVKGNTLIWETPGSVGFKGARRSSSYAAQVAGETIGRKALELGIRSIKVLAKGLGNGRESSIRGLQSVGLIVTSIEDITPVPHNGCRPKKSRRI